MPEAVIVSAARSPIGRAGKGSLKDMRPDDLTVQMVHAALAKVPALDPADIDDLMLGCGLPGRDLPPRPLQPLACTTGASLRRRPFWPVALVRARFRFGLKQRLRELTNRPFWPPAMATITLLTGASGALCTVARRRPWTESIRTATSMSTMPCRAKTASGRLWLEDLR